MSSITFRDTDEEIHVESLEDQIDIYIYDKAMAAHQVQDESISHQKMLQELNL